MNKFQKYLRCAVCIISENNVPQPCLDVSGCVFLHTEASLKSTLHKKTPQKRNLDLGRKLDEVYLKRTMWQGQH